MNKKISLLFVAMLMIQIVVQLGVDVYASEVLQEESGSVDEYQESELFRETLIEEGYSISNIDELNENIDIVQDYSVDGISRTESNLVDKSLVKSESSISLELSEKDEKKFEDGELDDINRNVALLNEGLSSGELVFDVDGNIVDAGLYSEIQPQAGRTTIKFTWKYIDVYFSTAFAQAIIWGGAGAAGSFCSGITATLGTGACYGAAGFLAGYVSTKTAEKYTKGLVIRVTNGKKSGLRSQ